jgi:hypothetical protein
VQATHPKKGLQIDENLTYQRREWLFERIGWCTMALVILAAVLGLLGSDPLNSAKSEPVEGVRFEYERRLHYGTCSELHFHLNEVKGPNGECHLWLSKEYLDQVHLKAVVPTPVRVEASSEGYTFIFRLSQKQQPVDLLFRIEPEKPGNMHGRARLGEHPSFDFEQFVYP